MALVLTLTFWEMNEKLPPTPGYYYVRFTDLLSEAYWNGFRWLDSCGKHLPDSAQQLFTHWARVPSGIELNEAMYPLRYLPRRS